MLGKRSDRARAVALTMTIQWDNCFSEVKSGKEDRGKKIPRGINIWLFLKVKWEEGEWKGRERGSKLLTTSVESCLWIPCNLLRALAADRCLILICKIGEGDPFKGPRVSSGIHLARSTCVPLVCRGRLYFLNETQKVPCLLAGLNISGNK